LSAGRDDGSPAKRAADRYGTALKRLEINLTIPDDVPPAVECWSCEDKFGVEFAEWTFMRGDGGVIRSIMPLCPRCLKEETDDHNAGHPKEAA
jgi:hypothetical protein